jgi:predicted kinase
MSCKIPYIEQQFRDVNPSLADTLNTKYSQIWDSVIESELFKKEEDTGKYLMATTNISRLQEQQNFIDKVNQDNSVPEGASVIENLNGYVNVNVLNLPEVTGESSKVEVSADKKFNPDLAPDGYSKTISINGKYIGEFALIENETEVQLTGSLGARTEIIPEERGKGYGYLAYVELAKQVKSDGKVLVSDSELSPDAERVWSKLTENGLAFKVTDNNGLEVYKIDNDKLPKSVSTPAIKEGVEELFNSNPKLANEVYEALGFKTKPDVILPIGTSGSGKSTFIKSLPQKDLVVIEPDAMRVEFTGDINNKSKDKEIYEEAAKRAVKAIKQGKQVVFDTTNLTKDKRLPFIEAIKKEIPNANIQYKLMELNPELAKQRIKAQIARGENRANVPDSTIDRHAESYKQMLEDIKYEPISNFEITPQQKQQAIQLYSQYLDTIFPDSKVKDIVYHGSQQKISQFEVRKEPLIHFGSKNAALQRGNILNQVILNVTDLQSIKDGMWFLGTNEGGLLKELLDRNILTLEQVRSINEVKDKAIRQSPYFSENYRMALPEGEKAGNKKLQEILANQNIGFEYVNFSEDTGSTSYAVPNQNQIHILGNKQDIEGFKEFVNKQPKPTIDYTSLDVTASLDAETKAKIDYLRNNDDLTVQC